MYTDINLVMISGRLLKDPEMGVTKNGKDFCRISIAANRAKRKDEEQQVFDVIECVAWGKLAQVVGKYFNVGDEIYIRGRILSNITKSETGRVYKNTSVEIREFLFGHKPEKSRERLKERLAAERGTTQTDEMPPLPTEEDMYAALGEDFGNEELPF